MIGLVIFYLFFIVNKSYENIKTNNEFILLISSICVAKAWYTLTLKTIKNTSVKVIVVMAKMFFYND